MECVPLFRRMQLMEDKTKHFGHVLPVSLLADDVLGALSRSKKFSYVLPEETPAT